MPFFRVPALFQNGLHVTCAIKEEEKMEERVGFLDSRGEEKKVGFFAKIEKGGELVCFHCKSIKEKVGLGG